MYSRNTSRKNGYRTPRNNTVQINTAAEVQNNQDVQNTDKTQSEENTPIEMPVAPPNYRGMIYEMSGMGNTENAEGIERIVRDDETYSGYADNARRRENMMRHRETPAFSHMHPLTASTLNAGNEQRNGLHRLIDGLQNKNFSPEDVLICAMIILMLNSSSEDDILMVLVLMMLL